MFKKQLGTLSLAITCIVMAFLLNASFDVFLEGPMGAFPFWTWVGLLFMTQAFPSNNAELAQTINDLVPKANRLNSCKIQLRFHVHVK